MMKNKHSGNCKVLCKNYLKKYQNKYRIASTRLIGWDYGLPGYYFITICLKRPEKSNILKKYSVSKTKPNNNPIKRHLPITLGKIINKKIILNDVGKIIQKYWFQIPQHFKNVRLDEFIIIPDHIHGIIAITVPIVETRLIASLQWGRGQWGHDHLSITGGGITGKHNPMFYQSIPRIVRWFKSKSTHTIHQSPHNAHFQWQPRYYDRIIWNQKSLDIVRKYIRNNPRKIKNPILLKLIK